MDVAPEAPAALARLPHVVHEDLAWNLGPRAQAGWNWLTGCDPVALGGGCSHADSQKLSTPLSGTRPTRADACRAPLLCS